jgi:hypothetical protein
VVRITLRVQIIGPAGGVVGVTTFTFTLAINGTGETVVEKANFADECR